jgi:anti-sigma regulatory factor (Ser/Thr protein kinase)
MIYTTQKVIKIPCIGSYLNETRGLISALLSKVDGRLTQQERELIVQGVQETLQSIVDYAEAKGVKNEISLVLEVDEVKFKASIFDSCKVFEPRPGLDAKQLEEYCRTERQYKLGISILKAVMDEIVYTYRKGFENELVAVKFW